jgi:two-component system sensor histidine kinase YesM
VDRATRKALAGFDCTEAEVATLFGWLDAGPAGRVRPVSIGGEAMLGTASSSSRFPFAYFIVAPADSFYRSSRLIGEVAVAFALTAFALGAFLVDGMARRNARLLDGIMDIVEAAGSGRPLPTLKQSRNEALNYISLSVLKTFVEHDYYKMRLREREYLQRSLELTALQSQMNPHFLFNALTTIGFKAMTLTEGPNGVTRMVELLSSILRYALADPTAPVRLRDEVENTRAYCEIQSIRFGEGIRYAWSVDEAALGLPCPRLILQPLVENALEHGFEGGARRGSVSIGARLSGGRLELAVEDDGVGISAEAMAALEARLADEAAAAEHVGLANTIKRLRITYGEEARFVAERRPGGGTAIRVSFPCPATPEGRPRSRPGTPD